MIAAQLEPRRGYLHQGAVFVGVPILWYSQIALVLRPKEEATYERLVIVRASQDRSAFQGEELTVASGKRRPVTVLSPRREIRTQRSIRVAAIYSYHEGAYLSRARADIENGDIPGWLHLVGDAALRLHDGAIDLGQIARVPRDVFDGNYLREVHEIASLPDASFALLLERLRAYLSIMDRGRPS